MTCDISNISIIILVKKVQEYKHDMTGENMWMKSPFLCVLFVFGSLFPNSSQRKK
jgi:hypothetical protein